MDVGAPVRFWIAAVCAVVLGTAFTLPLVMTSHDPGCAGNLRAQEKCSKGHRAPASPAGQNGADSAENCAGDAKVHGVSTGRRVKI